MRSFGLSAVLLAAFAISVGACKDDPMLKVTSIEPNVGDAAGQTYVRIRGNRFLTDEKGDQAPANAKVYFGNTLGQVDRFQADDEMIVIAPPGKPGETVDVLVTFEGRGEIRIPKAFTFVEKKTGGPSVNDLIKPPKS